ncbi:MurR/RpiR family transcriptional regulator [Carnobacterium gallinarum]|uniref:MurR/RpiR family transcriptional regulator n=1 Tax=Carnobacterium gallinarum TaxID=2749 RepID=UPI000551A062|nr:MurR/RpiR family transcriptional regulator [Carnobacterium gallinarum]
MLFLEEQVELNDTEMEIYHYITDNIDKVIFMRIRDLADEVHYSTTTVLRFCRKFECQGFAEFRIKLRMFRKNQKPIPIDTTDETTYIDFLNRTAQSEFKKSVQEVVDILAESELVIFIGIGASKLMAEYGSLYFSSLFLLSIHIDDLANHPLYYMSDQVSKKLCLFIVSVDGENQEIIKNIHHLKLQKTKIVSITNSAKSTIARLSDANISYYINKEQFQEANITSQLPALYTIELVGKEMRKQLNLKDIIQ